MNTKQKSIISAYLKKGNYDITDLADRIARARYEHIEVDNGLLESLKKIQDDFEDKKILFEPSDICRGILYRKYNGHGR